MNADPSCPGGLRALGLVVLVLALTVPTGIASAAITPTRDGGAVAAAIGDQLPGGATAAGSFSLIPPGPSALTQCANGIDDDGNGAVDAADPGCQGAGDNRELDDAPAQCANGSDDDFDVLVDAADPGCASAQDDTEEDGATNPTPQCANGIDDDDDGRVDLAADPGCAGADDLDEGSEGLPPAQDTDPAAVADTSLTGFPRSGGTYAILSSGSTRSAEQPNDGGGTSQSNGDDPGSAVHGEVRDLVQLRVDLDVPGSSNCLSVDVRFLSEEFPEFVGSAFNDGFVAELDTSDFQATASGISAPNNFAFDASGSVVSVNTVGFSEAEAAGTTYDGASTLLRAFTPITPGRHAVFFTVFDVSDSILDSAAFIDALRLFDAPAGTCRSGARTDFEPPDTAITGGPSGATGPVATFEFAASEAAAFQCAIDGAAFASCSSPFTTGALGEGGHSFAVRAIDGAGNVDASPATRSFTVVGQAPPPAPVLAVSVRAIPDPPVAGRSFEVVARVENRGTAAAPATVLELAVASGALPRGALPAGCRIAGRSVVCDVGTIPAGGSVERRITFVGGPDATFDVSANASSGQSSADTRLSGGGSRLRVATVPAAAAGVKLPPPVFRKTANLLRASGRVFVRVPGSRRFVRVAAGRQIPLGSVIDARRGRVSLITEKAVGGPLLNGTFYEGALQLSQAKDGLTSATLALGSFARCSGSSRARAARVTRPRGRRVRVLWGRSSGGHRTVGRTSAASVRGTQWQTVDYCNGTLTRVREGSVSVRDLAARRTVVVRAGRTYFAQRR